MKSALAKFQTLSLKDAAREFLAELGYKSDKFIAGVDSSPAAFLDLFAADHAFDQAKALFADWKSSLFTLIIGAVLVWALPRLWQWVIAGAVFQPDPNACQAARGVGACWGVIAEKYRVILFGRYPYDEQWRPLVATLLMVATVVVSCMRVFWTRWLALIWVAGDFSDEARAWATKRAPMTLLVEAAGPLSDDERKRVERFAVILGRQAE